MRPVLIAVPQLGDRLVGRGGGRGMSRPLPRRRANTVGRRGVAVAVGGHLQVAGDQLAVRHLRRLGARVVAGAARRQLLRGGAGGGGGSRGGQAGLPDLLLLVRHWPAIGRQASECAV